MFQNNPELTIAILYKLVNLIFSGFLCFLAYKSFAKDKQNKSGNITANWGKLSLILKNNPSGTIFLIAGLLITSFSIFRGINFTEKKTSNIENTSQLNAFSSDSLPDLSSINQLNIDSLVGLSKKSALKGKYLESLKYLYIIQGYCIEKKCDSSFLKPINADIKIYENQLSKSLNKEFDKSNNTKKNEEVRSTKISDTNNVEIR